MLQKYGVYTFPPIFLVIFYILQTLHFNMTHKQNPCTKNTYDNMERRNTTGSWKLQK